MKIKKIRIYILKKNKISDKIPLPNFYSKGFIFFQIETIDGVCGLGEPNPYLSTNPNTKKKIYELFIKFLKDRRIGNINLNTIKKKMKNKINRSLLSSFEHALYDILGKYKNKSVRKLLSNNKKCSGSLDLYASGGSIFENKSYDYLIDEALSFKEDGFVGWKFRPKMPISNRSHQLRINKPPRFNIRELLNFAGKLRKKVGDNFHLMLDAGCRCKDQKEAKYLIEGLKDNNFLFIEEPLKRNIKKYTLLNKVLNHKIDISGGEHFHNYDEFFQWFKFNCLDVYQPDSNLLLYEELSLIYKMIKKQKKSLIFHNWCNPINVCSNFSFISSLNSNIITEYNVVANDFYKKFDISSFKINKGKAKIIESPGLGIDFNNNKNKNFSIYEKKF
jgi:galactonate dehydratase